MRENNRRTCNVEWSTIVFVISMAIISAILFWRCRYGFADDDEAFYLTIPYRLCQGDSLFKDEWHLSQMASFLLYPCVKIYLLFHESTDDILLSFRYLYVTAQIAGTIVIYRQLRAYSHVGALLSALVFLIYAPFGIPALSYNSMGILFLTLSCVLMATNNFPLACIIAGVFFAFSVLCCPYLSVLYMAYIAIFVASCSNSKRKTEYLGSCKRSFIFFSIGVLITALVFLVFLFSKISVTDLINALPGIMNDPEHSSVPFISKIISYIHAIVHGNKIAPYITCAWIFLTITGCTIRSITVKIRLFFVAVLLTVLQLISCITYNDYINHLMLPVTCLTAFICMSFRNKKNRPVLFGIYIPGIIYTLCIHFTSNVELYAIASAATVACVGGTVIIAVCIRDNILPNMSGSVKMPIIIAMALFFCLQIGAELYYRCNDVFWDKELKYQKELLTEGPEAGILVSEEKSRLYKMMLEEVDELPNSESILFFSDKTWLYLCGKWKNGSYSAWLAGENEKAVNRLKIYYQRNPSKRPQTIYVEYGYEEFIDSFASLGYESIHTDTKGSVLISCTDSEDTIIPGG